MTIKHPLDLKVEITDTEALKAVPREAVLQAVKRAGFNLVHEREGSAYYRKGDEVAMIPAQDRYLYADCVAVTIQVIARVRGIPPLRVWLEMMEEYDG